MLLSTQRGRASLNLQDKLTAAMSYLVGREFEGSQPEVDGLEVKLPPALAKCVTVHEEHLGTNRRKTLADAMLLYRGPLNGGKGDAALGEGTAPNGTLNLIASRGSGQLGRHRREKVVPAPHTRKESDRTIAARGSRAGRVVHCGAPLRAGL